ncbi:hypothetical protein [Streptomyces tendae]
MSTTPSASGPSQDGISVRHAWDLRGARAAGMRTAYVGRPVGDPPTPTDAFDWAVGGLDELASELTVD